MHKIFANIKQNDKLSYQRKLYPEKTKSPMTYYFSTNVFQEFDEYYTKSK